MEKQIKSARHGHDSKKTMKTGKQIMEKSI